MRFKIEVSNSKSSVFKSNLAERDLIWDQTVVRHIQCTYKQYMYNRKHKFQRKEEQLDFLQY